MKCQIKKDLEAIQTLMRISIGETPRFMLSLFRPIEGLALQTNRQGLRNYRV